MTDDDLHEGRETLDEIDGLADGFGILGFEPLDEILQIGAGLAGILESDRQPLVLYRTRDRFDGRRPVAPG